MKAIDIGTINPQMTVTDYVGEDGFLLTGRTYGKKNGRKRSGNSGN